MKLRKGVGEGKVKRLMLAKSKWPGWLSSFHNNLVALLGGLRRFTKTSSLSQLQSSFTSIHEAERLLTSVLNAAISKHSGRTLSIHQYQTQKGAESASRQSIVAHSSGYYGCIQLTKFTISSVTLFIHVLLSSASYLDLSPVQTFDSPQSTSTVTSSLFVRRPFTPALYC